MVHLFLSSPKGNQGGKYFPYVGYLGLTPIRVDGVVRTKLDSDLKTLACRSLTISVRCYESRIGRVNTLLSNILVDYTQLLWCKPDDADYEQVGALEYPFRIWIPTTVAGFSTAVFVDYRCTWRVEAILNHVPITGVGSRQIRHFELPLIRYDIPPVLYPPLPDSEDTVVTLDQVTSKPRAPRIRYSLRAPTMPIGPLDLVSIPLHMQPVDQGVTIRSASVVIERRIHLNDLSTVGSAAATSPLPVPSSSHRPTSSPNAPLSSLPSSSSAPSNPYFPLHDSPSTHHDHSHIPSYEDPALSTAIHFSHAHHNINGDSATHQIHNQYSHHQHTASTSSLSSSNPTITPDTVYPSSVSSLVTFSSEAPLLGVRGSASSSEVATRGSSSNEDNPQPHHLQGPRAPGPSVAIFGGGGPTATASSSSSPNTKVVNNLIVDKETENFTKNPRTGVWAKTLTLQWPQSKSQSRWAIGETISSDLVTVRFFVKIKITVTSPTGTDTIELAEQELCIVSTNESERQLALAKYAELAESSSSADLMGRGKNKSPKRLTKDGGTSPLFPSGSKANGTGSGSGKKASAMRRPHTSAGPRDKSSFGSSSRSGGGGGTVKENGAGGDADPHRKRRSEASWVVSSSSGNKSDGASVTGHASGSSQPPHLPKNGFKDFNTHYNVNQDGDFIPGKNHSGNGDKSKAQGKEKSTTKQGRASSSGKLSSSSFWAVTAPPLKSGSSSGSSRGTSKGNRSEGAVVATTSTGSMSSTASTSSVSSGRSLGVDGYSQGNSNGSASWEGTGYGSGYVVANGPARRGSESHYHARGPRIAKEDLMSEEELEEGRRRRHFVREQQQKQKQSPSTSSSSSPPSATPPMMISSQPYQKYGQGYASMTTPQNHDDESHRHHVREWEEELARIEEKSRKESDLAGFGRMRKKSLMATMKGLWGSGDSSALALVVAPRLSPLQLVDLDTYPRCLDFVQRMWKHGADRDVDGTKLRLSVPVAQRLPDGKPGFLTPYHHLAPVTPYLSTMSNISWLRFTGFTIGLMGVGYALMKATTPSEEKLYNEMAPDIRRKVDAARAARQAREAEMKNQVDAQITNAEHPENTKPIWASTNPK